jgi:hypothetical protein
MRPYTTKFLCDYYLKKATLRIKLSKWILKRALSDSEKLIDSFENKESDIWRRVDELSYTVTFNTFKGLLRCFHE